MIAKSKMGGKRDVKTFVLQTQKKGFESKYLTFSLATLKVLLAVFGCKYHFIE